MKTYATQRPFRQYTAAEVEAFLNGSTNPYLAPLAGREDELRAWLAAPEVTTATGGRDAVLDEVLI